MTTLLMDLRYDGAPAMKDISVQHVKRSFVDDLFNADGLNFAETQKQIDASKNHLHFPLKIPKLPFPLK